MSNDYYVRNLHMHDRVTETNLNLAMKVEAVMIDMIHSVVFSTVLICSLFFFRPLSAGKSSAHASS